MAVTGDQRWPENRSFHRYRTQPTVEVLVQGATSAKGLCRDISIGGACVTVSMILEVGDKVELTIKLPDFHHPLHIKSVVCNKNGNRYGFKFQETTNRDRERIENFGRDSMMSAFLFTPDPGIVRSAQKVLQDMGVTKVWRGSPDSLPVQHPHIIMIDSDWPDFVEVAQLLRSESADHRIIIVGLMTRDTKSKDISDMGADIVLYKPLPRNWVERVMGTAVKLLGAKESKGDDEVF